MKIDGSKIEIYFSDLNKKAQKELLEEMVVGSPEDLNWDVVPLFLLETDFGEEYDGN